MKRPSYSKAAEVHPPLKRWACLVRPHCREDDAQHQSPNRSSRLQKAEQPTAVQSQRVSSESSRAEGEQFPQQHRASSQQQDTSACLPGHQEHSPSTLLVTHFNTYYGSLAKPDTWFTGGRSPVWVQPVTSTARIFSHTYSQYQLSADSLNHELKLLPAAARSLLVTAAALPWVQEQWSSRRSKMFLQEIYWSWHQVLLLLLQQMAFLTWAQSHLGPNLLEPESLLLPLSLLYPTKDVVKQNLWSLYSNRATNSANTAARKEGERQDVVAGTAAAERCRER